MDFFLAGNVWLAVAEELEEVDAGEAARLGGALFPVFQGALGEAENRRGLRLTQAARFAPFS